MQQQSWKHFGLWLWLVTSGLAVADPTNTVVRFTTIAGQFDVELFDTTAPGTVANFLRYVNRRAFNSSIIHRVVPNFVIQGGGFTSSASAIVTDPPITNEFGASNLRGTVAMARQGGQPDSATSQWYVNLADNSNPLDTTDGGYTVFGLVLGNGMTVVDAIAAIPTFPFASPFGEIPLVNYTSANFSNGVTPTVANFVIVSDVSVIASAGMAYVELAVGTPGGTISGGGLLPLGSNVTVTATPGNCAQFTSWTEGGTVVSSNASYTFTLTTNRTLVANFTQGQLTITTSANGNGTTYTWGTGNCGTYMRAYATPGPCAAFVNWTENGTVVSTSTNYLFTVVSNRNLVANFTATTNSILTSVFPPGGGTVGGDTAAACGSNATVCATEDPCYVFSRWTEAGLTVSTTPCYTFAASSNRNLVANFTPRAYTITSTPAAGGAVNFASLTTNCGATVTITATPATGFNFVNWTETGAVVSTSASYSFTVTGNRSLVANFVGLMIATGSALPTGTVGIVYNQAMRAAGGTPPYKWALVSGRLPAGLKFEAGSGTISGKPTAAGSSQFRLSVTDAANQSVSNDFTLAVHDLFGPLAATYYGLILPTNAPTFATAGATKIVLSKTGAFVASLALGGVNSTFKGQFDAAGNATNASTVLHLDAAGQMTGTVGTALLVADKPVFSARNPCPWVGKYNCLLEPTTNAAPVPQGDGYATLTVVANGTAALAGTLADGTALNVTLPVAPSGASPLYKLLYRNKGAVIGWVTLATNGTATATVDWFKPGFNTALTFTGTKLTPPAGNGTWQLRLTAGDLLSDIIKTVTVAAGKVTLPPADSYRLTLKVTSATGKFTGSFVHPVSKKTTAFTGLFLQAPENDAGGFFLGPHTSGAVTLEP